MASLATGCGPDRLSGVNDSRSLSDETAWAAVLRRDRSADGSFVTGVLTTGIYCRPYKAVQRTGVEEGY